MLIARPSAFSLISAIALVLSASTERLPAQTPAAPTSTRSSTQPATQTGSLHERAVAQYLAGDWDRLSEELQPRAKEITALPPEQKADLDYIRKAMAECRPAWWKPVKTGGKFRFKPVVWGHTLIASFDENATTNIQINYVNGTPSVVVKWEVKEMDDPAEAEHGFSKGALNDMSVWSTLGTADSWMNLSLRSQRNLDDAGKLLLSRYLTFRGCVAGAYYGMPRGRQWDLWLGLWAFSAEHANDPNIMARRAMGSFLISELMEHRPAYPSSPLADATTEEPTEAALAPRLQKFLAEGAFTLKEEITLREAIKAFAAANENKPRTTGRIALPNGLAIALDIDDDAPLAKDRQAWIKQHLPPNSIRHR